MRLLFLGAKRESIALDKIEQAAARVHKKNINKIVKTRQKADKLNTVLKQNNITLQLARAMGHRS